MTVSARALKAFGLAAVFALLVACSRHEKVIGEGAGKAYELVLAVAGDTAAVAWHGADTGLDAIHLQWLDPEGRPRSQPRAVTDGRRRAYEPDLQLIDGDPLLAWYEKDPETTDLTAWLARLNAKGEMLWRRPLSAAGGQARNPVVRVAKGVIHVAWIEGAKSGPIVFAATFDAEGGPAAPARIVGRASAKTYNLNAAVDAAGRFYVTYDAQFETKASELYLSVVDGSAVRALRLSGDDGFASVYPDLGLGPDGQAALTWADARDGNPEIYLSVLPLASLTGAGPHPARRLTDTPAASTGAYLAWNGDRLVVVWCDKQEGQSELYAQAFSRSGQATTPIRRLTRSLAQSSIPTIRASGDGFLVAWNAYQTHGAGGHGDVASSTAMTLRLAAKP